MKNIGLLCASAAVADALVLSPSAVVPQRPAACVRAHMTAEGWGGYQEELILQHAPREDPLPVGSAKQMLRDVQSAWVLVFHSGTDDEATYIMQDRLSDSPDLLLAFDRQEDALRFAQQLEAESFAEGLAEPVEKTADTLCHFCEAHGFRMSLVPVGLLALPPTRAQQEDAVHASSGLEATGPSAALAASPIEWMRKFLEERFFDI